MEPSLMSCNFESEYTEDELRHASETGNKRNFEGTLRNSAHLLLLLIIRGHNQQELTTNAGLRHKQHATNVRMLRCTEWTIRFM